MQRNELINKILIKFEEVSDAQCKEENAQECPICLAQFDKEEKIVNSPCHHLFHFKCIYEWISKSLINSKCPICNFILIENCSNDMKKKENNETNSYELQSQQRINLITRARLFQNLAGLNQ